MRAAVGAGGVEGRGGAGNLRTQSALPLHRAAGGRGSVQGTTGTSGGAVQGSKGEALSKALRVRHQRRCVRHRGYVIRGAV